MHDSHDKHHAHHGHHEHHEDQCGVRGGAAPGVQDLETGRLRKMVEHWISHNEDHAGSYRLWAGRAREAGHEAAGAILEEIASEVVKQNEKFAAIVRLIDSSK